MFEEMKYIIIGFSTLLIINIMIQYSYPYFGCTDLSITNVFRGNLICVAFTNVNYHIQNFQIQFYLAIAGLLMNKSNTIIQNIIKFNME